MFCVECGKEGKVFEALCPSCFLKRKKLIELPKTIDITLCSTCDSMLVDKKWIKQELESTIDQLISSSIWQNPIIEILELHSERQFEDAKNISVKIKTKIGLGSEEKDIHDSIRVRLKSGTCPTCSMQHGGYYEAILQIRPGSKSLSNDILNEIKNYVHSRVFETPDKERKVFISKEEYIHKGVDFYLSSNRIAKSIAKELAKKHEGTVNASPKLHGRVKGKEIYRVTYIVRLP